MDRSREPVTKRNAVTILNSAICLSKRQIKTTCRKITFLHHVVLAQEARRHEANGGSAPDSIPVRARLTQTREIRAFFISLGGLDFRKLG